MWETKKSKKKLTLYQMTNDKSKVVQMAELFPIREENCRKWENAGHQHFLLYACF